MVQEVEQYSLDEILTALVESDLDTKIKVYLIKKLPGMQEPKVILGNNYPIVTPNVEQVPLSYPKQEAFYTTAGDHPETDKTVTVM